MNDRLPPVAHDKIPTLIDHAREGKFVIAFCPICDRVEEASENGRGREGATANSIAKIQLHIRKSHPPKTKRVKIPAIIRNPGILPYELNIGERQAKA